MGTERITPIEIKPEDRSEPLFLLAYTFITSEGKSYYILMQSLTNSRGHTWTSYLLTEYPDQTLKGYHVISQKPDNVEIVEVGNDRKPIILVNGKQQPGSFGLPLRALNKLLATDVLNDEGKEKMLGLKKTLEDVDKTLHGEDSQEETD